MDSPPPPVSPPTSHPHGQRMMRMPPGAPPPPGPSPYGTPSHGMPPPYHHMSGPPPSGPGGACSPPSSNGGSRPSSMPGSPASGVSSHGYHSGHSGHPYGHGPPPTHHGGMSPHTTSSTASPGGPTSPRGMNTPSPPPHQIGGPGLAGSKVTPDAAARVAHAKATGEPPVGPPTWRRMPCKARSVPDGHTAETAYLTIPPNAQHGLVLACSHPECRQSGKRFRFCAVCDLPVAKRNFLKRHSHGLVTAARSPRTDDDEDEDAPEEKHSPMDTSSEGEKKSDDKDSNSKNDSIVKSKSEDGVTGASAPTSRGSAFAGSQYKRPREAGSTPPRDSDLDRDGDGKGGSYPPFHGGPPINQAMSWPPHAEGHPSYHPGVDSHGRDAAGRLGLSPYQPGQGYPGPHGHHPAYSSPPGSHHHQMHHIPPHNYNSSPGMGPPPPHAHHPGAPYHSPPGTEYTAPGNSSGAFRGLPPNHGAVGGSSGGPSPQPDEFEPPQPEYSVMRLSRREREWLQLYRTRPDSSDREATNEWVNKCLSYSEPLAETHDDGGGGVETVLRDRSSSHATGKHSASTVQAKTVVTPPGSDPKAKSSSDGPANISNDTSGDLPAAGDDLALSPCRPRHNTGGSLSTLSMTGESVTELLEHAGLMDGDLGDMPLVDDPGRSSLKVGDRSVSSADVSPISNHGAETGVNGTKRGSFRGSPENAPPMPSLGGRSYPNESVRDSLQRAKIEGERAAASGRSSTRPSSPHAGADTPVNMDGEPSWGCSFLPPLCGAFNM
eukprot:CAMPEP_0178472386 /NCGR_PEP_ID=MMETSP0696-20121128/1543_1 /TAXON_ID=265572 /ORGANISM="Extubocellulus spinifer, Strain CCMP396" /LENGTH=773 /DNA_ID=CAMNT_0020099573 /DNA_START=488 /DNA_END=2809 /DNA_ORIENTATION=-